MDDLKEILAAATPGPWAYRPTEYDDWGTVRAGKGFICQAKDPRFHDSDFLNDCRARNIDPWSANARLIAMAPDLAVEVLRLRAEVERLTEALTPSRDTKAAYMGEIHCDCPTENWKHFVPWTSIKEIMAMIRARAALKAKGTE